MFRKHIAMDLGTANTLVYVQSEGIVLNEPSVVAKDIIHDRILAVGKQAKEFIGKTPQKIKTIRPLKDGVIADFDMASVLIEHFLRPTIRGFVQRKPYVLLCVPSQITNVERRSVIEAAIQAGAQEVTLIEESLAAAIGAGLPVRDPVGSMVVDIGGGTTDVAILSLGAIAHVQSIRVAGDALTASIQRYLQETQQIVLGENLAEKVKIELGAVDALASPLQLEVSGKDVATASPKTLTLTSDDIREAIQPTVNQLIETILRVLEQTPPELSADLLQQGILLTGGGALLRGLDTKLAAITKLPVRIDPEPLTTVLRGAGIVLDDPARYQELLVD